MLELDGNGPTTFHAHPPVDRRAVDELASLEAAVQALHEDSAADAPRPTASNDDPGPAATTASQPAARADEATADNRGRDRQEPHGQQPDDHAMPVDDQMIMIGVGGYTARGGPMTAGAAPRRAHRLSRRFR